MDKKIEIRLKDSEIPKNVKVATTTVGIPVEQCLQSVCSDLKWCYLCKKNIHRDLFGNNAGNKTDGKNSRCNNCDKGTQHYYDVQFRRDGDKKQARKLVNNAVKRGILPHARFISCNDCGHVGNDRVHEYDHYLGYAAINHLDVQAVCASCHHKRTWQRRKQLQGPLVTVKEAIEMLQKCSNPDTQVRIHFEEAKNDNI
ncbi:hypothetical protein QUA41_30715 [Microcoleus sp. Pol11C1]|uniref:hypothetical protein n=1 Tax=unclassified Microcoleus TaxID=2642155 RepID=UPI002FD1CBF3